MLFDIKNGPEIFQHYINNLLHEFLDVFVTVYIDNILIYLFMLFKHQKHVHMILECLKKADLQCNIKKCKFYVTEVIYLDLIISHDDIKMNSVKMKAIISWKNLNNVHDIWSFLDFVNFYWWFIKHFLKIVWSLVNLIKKDTKFLWDVKCKHVFNDLKNWFMTVSILAHFDSDFKCVLKTDLSDHALESVLLEYDENDILHSVTYFSQKLNITESNYEIYNKELLTIIQCFEQWQSELKESAFLIQVLINHKNLQYFMITKQLTHWQTWWAEYMSWFNFKIMYQSDNQNQKSDMLTWWSQDLSVNFFDEWIANQLQILLLFEQFEKIWLVFTDSELDKDESEIDKWDMNLDELMNYKYTHNSWIAEIMNTIKTDQQ